MRCRETGGPAFLSAGGDLGQEEVLLMAWLLITYLDGDVGISPDVAGVGLRRNVRASAAVDKP